MQLERLVDQTNSICKEGSKDLNLSQDVISVSSLKLSSLMSGTGPTYPSKDKNTAHSLFAQNDSLFIPESKKPEPLFEEIDKGTNQDEITKIQSC